MITTWDSWLLLHRETPVEPAYSNCDQGCYPSERRKPLPTPLARYGVNIGPIIRQLRGLYPGTEIVFGATKAMNPIGQMDGISEPIRNRAFIAALAALGKRAANETR